MSQLPPEYESCEIGLDVISRTGKFGVIKVTEKATGAEKYMLVAVFEEPGTERVGSVPIAILAPDAYLHYDPPGEAEVGIARIDHDTGEIVRLKIGDMQ